jgi:hypothetical protein
MFSLLATQQSIVLLICLVGLEIGCLLRFGFGLDFDLGEVAYVEFKSVAFAAFFDSCVFAN